MFTDWNTTLTKVSIQAFFEAKRPIDNKTIKYYLHKQESRKKHSYFFYLYTALLENSTLVDKLQCRRTIRNVTGKFLAGFFHTQNIDTP